jgi:hypothetical protein
MLIEINAVLGHREQTATRLADAQYSEILSKISSIAVVLLVAPFSSSFVSGRQAANVSRHLDSPISEPDNDGSMPR